jgi:hypothetical protein
MRRVVPDHTPSFHHHLFPIHHHHHHHRRRRCRGGEALLVVAEESTQMTLCHDAHLLSCPAAVSVVVRGRDQPDTGAQAPPRDGHLRILPQVGRTMHQMTWCCIQNLRLLPQVGTRHGPGLWSIGSHDAHQVTRCCIEAMHRDAYLRFLPQVGRTVHQMTWCCIQNLLTSGE